MLSLSKLFRHLINVEKLTEDVENARYKCQFSSKVLLNLATNLVCNLFSVIYHLNCTLYPIFNVFATFTQTSIFLYVSYNKTRLFY